MNAGATRSAGKGSHPERRVALTALAATTAAIVQVASGDETAEAAFVRTLARLGSQAVTLLEVPEPGGKRMRLEVVASVVRAGSVASDGRGGSSVTVASAGCGAGVAAAGSVAPGSAAASGVLVGRIRSAGDAGVVTGGLAGAATGFDAHAVDGPGKAEAIDAVAGVDLANVAASAAGTASVDVTDAGAWADVAAARVVDFDVFFVLADGHCPDRYATASGPFSSAWRSHRNAWHG